MPLQETWTGLIASSPASIRSPSKGSTPPQQWSCTLTFAQFLGPVEQLRVEWLEQAAVRVARDQRATLGAQVVAEEDHVDVGPHGAEPLFQIRQVQIAEPLR